MFHCKRFDEIQKKFCLQLDSRGFLVRNSDDVWKALTPKNHDIP